MLYFLSNFNNVIRDLMIRMYGRPPPPPPPGLFRVKKMSKQKNYRYENDADGISGDNNAKSQYIY